MRKRRTREHIIADLSVNHVERYFLLGGHTVQRVDFDYGYDLFIQTFNDQGELEAGYLLIQLKATDALRRLSGGTEAVITVERRDVESWLADPAPVALIVYDAVTEIAYWLMVQNETLTQQMAESTSVTLTLRIPSVNKLDVAAVGTLCNFKNQVFNRTKTNGENLQNN